MTKSIIKQLLDERQTINERLINQLLNNHKDRRLKLFY